MKYESYIMIELTFLKELMLIRQANYYWNFLGKGFCFNQIYAIDAMIY